MLERGARSRSVPVPRFRKSFAQSNIFGSQAAAEPHIASAAVSSERPSSNIYNRQGDQYRIIMPDPVSIAGLFGLLTLFSTCHEIYGLICTRKQFGLETQIWVSKIEVQKFLFEKWLDGEWRHIPHR
jgi:hypothetical protein